MKAALKTFADIDVFDIEVDETDPERFIDTVVAISKTFGGINLEDIKAPECFEIERRIAEATDIPVMHDDQHGTAIISAAALINACELQGKAIGDVKVVVIGAGASAIACANHYGVGCTRAHHDVRQQGIVTAARLEAAKSTPTKRPLPGPSCATPRCTRVLTSAACPVGTGPATWSPAWLSAHRFAFNNPTPEILPDEVMAVRNDAPSPPGARLSKPSQQRPWLLHSRCP